MSFNLYWGDLHNHCSVSYGGGTVEQAIQRARGQLDFCSITGHAFWPDMPTDRDRYGEIIDYHNEGFARLARNWNGLLEQEASQSHDGEFVMLPSYEWHSLEFGDHNVYARGPELALRDAPDLPALQQLARDSGAVVIPHHIGYASGYRGIDWRHFREDVSPFVEIFSLHGCSVDENAPYPMLHDMGPRDFGSTAEAGWRMGHRFGIIASTDHHGGYPGSHGDGRVGILANSLTATDIWEALLARRVYAVTGDKIDARMFINDACIGSSIKCDGKRHIRIQVRGSDALDRVDLVKNRQVIRAFFPVPDNDQLDRVFRLRVTWGWGRKDEPVPWDARLSLSNGEITAVESCFSGQAMVAPKGVGGHDDAPDEEDLPHEILESAPRSLTWRSITTGNRSTRHPATQAISLEIASDLDATLRIDVNGQRFEHSLGDLLRVGHAHYLRGWLSEAIRIGPLVPIRECRVDAEFEDFASAPSDRYRLSVAQHNGQWAWLSPIWVDQ